MDFDDENEIDKNIEAGFNKLDQDKKAASTLPAATKGKLEPLKKEEPKKSEFDYDVDFNEEEIEDLDKPKSTAPASSLNSKPLAPLKKEEPKKQSA